MDAEFDAIKLTLDELLANLAILQRDDTELANRTVGAAQLKTGVAAGVDPATAWATSTAYAVNDLVWQSGKLYICETAHTSGTFATDLASGYWTEILDLAAEVPAVSGILMNSVEVASAASSSVGTDDNGKTIYASTGSNNVTLNLPAISALTDDDFFRVLAVKPLSANSLILDADGSDTINGAATQTFTAQLSAALLFSRNGSTDWTMIDLSPPGASSNSTTRAVRITNFKLTGC